MKVQYKQLLKEYNYLKVVLATFITRIGDGIDMVAFSWLVYEITGSTALVATICGVSMIPNLTFGVIAGGLCKYINEKTLMWLCDFGRGLCVALIALLYMSGYLAVWHLFIMMFMISTLESLRSPAQTSIFPKILNEEMRENGLAIQQSLVGAANLIGLGFGPLCIGLFGLGGAILIDALTFFICGVIILSLRHIKRSISEEKISMKGYVDDLKEGFIYTKKDKLLMNICIFACIVNALSVPMTIFEAPYIKDYLQMGSEGIAILGVASVLGMIVVSPFVPKLKEKICYRNMFLFGGVLIGIMYVFYAGLPLLSSPFNYILLALTSFLVGVFLTFVNLPLQITLYRRVEQSYLARFSSLMGAMSLAAQPLASFFFGILSGFMSVDSIYLVCGAITIILFAMQVVNKVLWQLNEG
ncbi:MAG: MFS transporter [Erysipelotrichia bacterium]|nr:MFS transporter [Erysipelotrichia bacterium]NCC55093.1 MFS transporter [Erysipelotrichia bacterium]